MVHNSVGHLFQERKLFSPLKWVERGSDADRDDPDQDHVFERGLGLVLAEETYEPCYPAAGLLRWMPP